MTTKNLNRRGGWDGKCSICRETVPVAEDSHGHNAEPVNSGRCCSACNASAVIPARIERLRLLDETFLCTFKGKV